MRGSVHLVLRPAENDMGFAPLQELGSFVRLADYAPPAEPAPERFRSGLRRLWTRMREPDTPPARPVVKEDLVSLPERLRDWAAPPPRWEEMGGSVAAGPLGEWLARGPESAGPLLFVVPPCGGVRGMIESLSAAGGCTAVAPPSTEQVLGGGASWLSSLAGREGERCFLAGLERCFLRHRNGLRLVRRLLGRLGEKRPPWLLACDSWAWAYLRKALSADAVFPDALTLAPVDGEKLGAWLHALAPEVSGARLTYRSAETGARVLGPDAEGPGEGEASSGREVEYLRRVAARSRGNPGVAWAVWRHALMISEGEGVADEAVKAATVEASHAVWVRPWARIGLPEMPGSAGTVAALVLHAVLVHGGLPRGSLDDLLPLLPVEIDATVEMLRRGGLLAVEEGMCRVTAVGYPAVRSFLWEEGFVVDDL